MASPTTSIVVRVSLLSWTIFARSLSLAAIDLLIWPCEVIAGSYRGVLWVLLKEFALHIVDDGGREEDTHRTLTFRQQVQVCSFSGIGVRPSPRVRIIV